MSFVKPQIHFSNFWVIFITCSISIIFWLLFKSIYPYPFFTADSYFYVETADLNIDVSLWPVGYAKFIRLIGIFSHSSMVFVTCQYFLFQFSLLSLFLTIRKYIFSDFWLLAILYVFFFINPLFIIASNHIMSDIVFSSLSIFWLLQLVWIILNPKWYVLLFQAILLVIALSFRYSGLFYPIISMVAFIISPMKLVGKFIGIVVMFLGLTIFVQFTENKMEEITGVKEFSSTSGWKKACNALYMYQHIAAYDNSQVPVKFQIIHRVVKSYFKRDHTPTDLYNTTEDPTTGCFYIWMNESPLLEYVKVVLGHGINIIDFRELAPFNQYMNDYGNFLIRRHPLDYCQYVLLPNLYRYFFPLGEIYGTSKGLGFLWRDFLGDHVKAWFGIESLSLPIRLFILKDKSISVYPKVFTIIHIFFVVTLFLFCFFQKNERKINYAFKVYLLLLSICIFHFIFYSLLAISVIRFQFLVIIIEFSLVLFHINSLKNRVYKIGNS